MLFDIINTGYYLNFFESSYNAILLLLVLSLLLPIIGAFFCKSSSDKTCGYFNLFFSFATFFVTLVILLININSSSALFKKGITDAFLLSTLYKDFAIKFSFEPLGLYFATLTSFLWFVTSIYCLGYLKAMNIKNKGNFYFYFSLSMFCVIGISYSDNLITTFIFYELLTIFTFPLVVFYKTPESIRAGKVYLMYLLGTSFLFLLPAIIITYYFTGSITYTEGGVFNEIPANYIGILILLYIFGLGKIATFPFHKWLPNAMVAPTPVSALLHAVAVVKSGVFILIKVFIYIFDSQKLGNLARIGEVNLEIISYIICFGIVFASIKACLTKNIKEILAYSTISMLAYIVLALLLTNKVGNNAAIILLITHAFAKISLFFISGAILISFGAKYLDEIKGVSKFIPLTMFMFLINAVSIIGFPLTGGLFAKYFLLLSQFNIQNYVAFATIVISTVLSAFYLIRIYVYSFANGEDDKSVLKQKFYLPKSIVVATCISTIFTITLFFLPWII